MNKENLIRVIIFLLMIIQVLLLTFQFAEIIKWNWWLVMMPVLIADFIIVALVTKGDNE